MHVLRAAPPRLGSEPGFGGPPAGDAGVIRSGAGAQAAVRQRKSRESNAQAAPAPRVLSAQD
jgi:hypothetical protein